MTTAFTRGRNLIIRHGDEEDHVDVVVKPANAEDGLKLLQYLVARNSEALSKSGIDVEQIAETADEVFAMAFGRSEDALKQVQLLRDEESQLTFFAALFWNTKGGRTADVQEYLEEQDYPKALIRLFEQSGLIEFGQSLTSPSGELASPTPTEDIPATFTRRKS